MQETDSSQYEAFLACVYWATQIPQSPPPTHTTIICSNKTKPTYNTVCKISCNCSNCSLVSRLNKHIPQQSILTALDPPSQNELLLPVHELPAETMTTTLEMSRNVGTLNRRESSKTQRSTLGEVLSY